MLPGEEGLWLVIIYVGIIFAAVMFGVIGLGVLSCFFGIKYKKKSKDSLDSKTIKKYKFWSYFWFCIFGLDVLLVFGFICREVILNLIGRI